MVMCAAADTLSGTLGKDYLSPGVWTVSVTYPDGQPLPCGPDAQPCGFYINVG
jgi:hypothetical protein